MTSLVNGVSFHHIRHLLQVLRGTEEQGADFLRGQYTNKFANFESVIPVLKELNLLTEAQGKIRKAPELQRIGSNILADPDYSQKYLIDKILSKSNLIHEEAIAYLSNFNMRNGRYEYRPATESRVLESPIRNLLVELELVQYEIDNGAYFISSKHLDEFLKIGDHIPLSPAGLEEILLERRKIGLAAEHEVINYEKVRLANNKHHSASIIHKSLEDVACGYDILSYENINEDIRRFIEVKAVSAYDYGFVWSRSEIERAKELKLRYFLYLIPVRAKDLFDISSLVIIGDPATKVLENSEWQKSEESIRVSRATINVSL